MTCDLEVLFLLICGEESSRPTMFLNRRITMYPLCVRACWMTHKGRQVIISHLQISSTCAQPQVFSNDYFRSVSIHVGRCKVRWWDRSRRVRKNHLRDSTSVDISADHCTGLHPISHAPVDAYGTRHGRRTPNSLSLSPARGNYTLSYTHLSSSQTSIKEFYVIKA